MDRGVLDVFCEKSTLYETTGQQFVARDIAKKSTAELPIGQEHRPGN